MSELNIKSKLSLTLIIVKYLLFHSVKFGFCNGVVDSLFCTLSMMFLVQTLII